MPKVGETIITKATLVSKFVGDDYTLCTMSCNSSVEDQILLECEINLFIQKQFQLLSNKFQNVYKKPLYHLLIRIGIFALLFIGIFAYSSYTYDPNPYNRHLNPKIGFFGLAFF